MHMIFEQGQPLGVPRIGDADHVLLTSEGQLALFATLAADGTLEVMAAIDPATAFGYPCSATCAPQPDGTVQVSDIVRDETPLVTVTGNIAEDARGQVLIRQTDGHYRRYSIWSRINGTRVKPNAILQSLPQCGCGGYLGAPMTFDSFAEMTSYFFLVFADAEAVDAKHAASMCSL